MTDSFGEKLRALKVERRTVQEFFERVSEAWKIRSSFVWVEWRRGEMSTCHFANRHVSNLIMEDQT